MHPYDHARLRRSAQMLDELMEMALQLAEETQTRASAAKGPQTYAALSKQSLRLAADCRESAALKAQITAERRAAADALDRRPPG